MPAVRPADRGAHHQPRREGGAERILLQRGRKPGFFDKTDRNLFEGQDLDVPTYLRKGIKITV